MHNNPEEGLPDFKEAAHGYEFPDEVEKDLRKMFAAGLRHSDKMRPWHGPGTWRSAVDNLASELEK